MKQTFGNISEWILHILTETGGARKFISDIFDIETTNYINTMNRVNLRLASLEDES